MNRGVGLLQSACFLAICWVAMPSEADPLKSTFYVQQTNGLFQVGEFDLEAGAAVCYPGVCVAKEQLPVPGPISHYHIYALPELRPPPDPDGDPWNPRPEELYIYGKPMLPLVDGDPALMAYDQEDGRVAVGLASRDGFFLFFELGREDVGADVAVLSCPLKHWRQTILSPERLAWARAWAGADARGTEEGEEDGDGGKKE